VLPHDQRSILAASCAFGGSVPSGWLVSGQKSATGLVVGASLATTCVDIAAQSSTINPTAWRYAPATGGLLARANGA